MPSPMATRRPAPPLPPARRCRATSPTRCRPPPTRVNIVSNILKTSSTFTAPTVSVNAFNRTQTLSDLYVSVFQPSLTYHWPGNVKKYSVQNGVIMDQNTVAAVDPTAGFFKNSAQSFWSASPDGSTVTSGGAASQIPDWNPANA